MLKVAWYFGVLSACRMAPHMQPADMQRCLCRAPYDNIFTAEGVSLRKRAEQLPNLDVESPRHGQALAAVADQCVAPPLLSCSRCQMDHCGDARRPGSQWHDVDMIQLETSQHADWSERRAYVALLQV